MMSVAEKNWKAFRRFELPELHITEEPDRISFVQADEAARSARMTIASLIGAVGLFAGLFFGLDQARNGGGTWTPALFALAGMILPVVIIMNLFVPKRRVEVRRGSVLVADGSRTFEFSVDEIKSLDVQRQTLANPNSSCGGTLEYGLITIWCGPWPNSSLLIEGYSAAISVSEGIKAAIGVLNQPSAQNPTPTMPGRRQAFAE